MKPAALATRALGKRCAASPPDRVALCIARKYSQFVTAP
jgi:hypothetical protein